MNSTEMPKKVNLPDTEVEWYDFGGGHLIAPTIDAEGNVFGLGDYKGPNVASLCCVKNGKFYYYTLEGTFTKEDLPSMFKDYAPVFKTEVDAASTQETQ
jgi:hypothetical protein